MSPPVWRRGRSSARIIRCHGDRVVDEDRHGRRMAGGHHLLDVIRETGIAVTSPFGETTPSRHPPVRECGRGGRSCSWRRRALHHDSAAMEPTLVHRALITDADFTGLTSGARKHGFACAVDMQGFVRQVDGQVGKVMRTSPKRRSPAWLKCQARYAQTLYRPGQPTGRAAIQI
jgi:hypothetical protein